MYLRRMNEILFSVVVQMTTSKVLEILKRELATIDLVCHVSSALEISIRGW